ncbi:MAG: hypothetical protein IPJ13_24425 [Saprospiraceae bacterium]|nr:hypothetical protein [Saprospiraceae bacterium]
MLVAIVWLGNIGSIADFSLATIYGLEIGTQEQLFVFGAFMLAYGIKTPLFPFHSWLPDTYTLAPAPVTIMLSGVMSKMALYSIIRFVLPVVPRMPLEQYGIYVVYFGYYRRNVCFSYCINTKT